MSNLTAAETQVRKLARLPGNCVCPNCGLETTKFGFGNVCVKFHTFVCNDCKSSHQAISHRCKSITMSTWTKEEVDTLAKHGNDVARQTWLKHAPQPGTRGRPKPGSSDISVYKTFVVEVYEKRKYYGEAVTCADGGVIPDEPKPSMISSVQQQQQLLLPAFAKAPPLAFAKTIKETPQQPVMMIAPVVLSANPTADLLDFFTEPSNTTTAAADFSFSADFGEHFQSPAGVVSSLPATSEPSITSTTVDSFTTTDYFGDFQVTPPVKVSCLATPTASASLIPPPPHKTMTTTPMTTTTTTTTTMMMNPQSTTISNMMSPAMMNHSLPMQNGGRNGGMMTYYYSNGNNNNNNTMSMNSGRMMPNGMMTMNNGAMPSMTSSSGMMIMPMNYGMSNNNNNNNMNEMTNHGFLARNGMNNSNNSNNSAIMNNGFAMYNSNGMSSSMNNTLAMSNPPSYDIFPQNTAMTHATTTTTTKSDPFADLRPFQS